MVLRNNYSAVLTKNRQLVEPRGAMIPWSGHGNAYGVFGLTSWFCNELVLGGGGGGGSIVYLDQPIKRRRAWHQYICSLRASCPNSQSLGLPLFKTAAMSKVGINHFFQSTERHASSHVPQCYRHSTYFFVIINIYLFLCRRALEMVEISAVSGTFGNLLYSMGYFKMCS